MINYQEFINNKSKMHESRGINEFTITAPLFEFQREIVAWALRKGRSAIFADCGLGKTLMQLEWARIVSQLEGPVLILAPLAVAHQTVKEGAKFGIDVYYERSQPSNLRGITIANYEMLHEFDCSKFSGIVLDESSILKSYSGKIRTQIIESFVKTPFKLACTATPAPNDFMELGNHAEFLGIMSREEMLSMYFVHDGGETQKWRIKGHAQDPFWKWMCSWSVDIRRPSDLGYDDGGFSLPELKFIQHSVKAENKSQETLFAMQASTLQERIQARRDSISDRVAKVAEIVGDSKEQWLIWCNLNNEAEGVKKLLKCVEVRGSDTPDQKRDRMLGFSSGEVQILVTKPSIAGFGMNWQNCNNVIFLGLSDSYEEFYQAIRRCWRFGQKKEVNCHIVISDTEGAVLKNIQRKESDSEKMAEKMVKHMAKIMRGEMKATTRESTDYKENVVKSDKFTAYMGDCCERIKEIESGTVDYSIFSPPFSSLYTYSNSDRDMGNSKNDGEFFQHFDFLIKELFRTLRAGRLVSFHCMNLPTSKQNHGYIGIRDFRGDLIRAFEKEGFIYHSEVVIWKDPVIAMQRTKALGLLHKQLKKDSAMSRQGIPDYLVTMRKPGTNDKPVTHTNESFPVGVWQKYASPVWTDINPSDTLQFRSAREHDDERHICPLQLQVINRALDLWTNPGDLVLSPFMGIGSEGFCALSAGRKFVGIELKESYYKQAVKNLQSVTEAKQQSLFGMESFDLQLGA